MTQTGIIAYGAYIPRLRLEKKSIASANSWANSALRGHAKGHRSMKGWDEDALTMAVEAARDCLDDNTDITNLVVASTSLPFQDRLAAGLVGATLSLEDNVISTDQGGSMRAGTTAMMQALSGPAKTLVVASDSRAAKPGSVQEITYGDGAASLLLGTSENIIARYLGGHTLNVDFVDHFRSSSEKHEFHWEERWVRDEGINKIVPKAIKSALDKTGIEADKIDHFIFPSTIRRATAGVARKCGIAEDAVRDTLQLEIGETGTAHPLLMLAHVLETATAGEIILVASFGFGADVLLFEVTGAIENFRPARGVTGSLRRKKEEQNYQKFLSFNGEVSMEWGIRQEAKVKTALTAQYRVADEMAAFLGGKCSECGTVQFPRARICVNPDCDHMGEQEKTSLLGQKASIMSFTADRLSFKGAPPFCFGLVQFENGARVLMEFIDVDEDLLKVGNPVELVYRKKEIDPDRAYHSYFWKAVPVEKT